MLLLLPLLTFLAFALSAQFGLDITDEAVHYYFLKFGPSVHYNHTAFGIFHYPGILWNHSAIGYRWMSLILIGFTAVNFTLAVTHYLKGQGVRFALSQTDIAALAWLASFGFFDVLPTSPHYNSFVFIFLFNSLAVFFWAIHAMPLKQSLYSALIAFLVLGSWCSKPPGGLLNLALIAFLFYLHRSHFNRRVYLIGIVSLLLASSLTYLAFDWSRTFAIAKALSLTAHRPWQLLYGYFDEGWHFLLRQVFPLFTAFMIAHWQIKKSSTKRANLILTFLWIGLMIWWISPLFRSEAAYSWSRNSAGAAAALMVFVYWLSRERQYLWLRPVGFCLLLNLLAGLACALGTNNSLTNWVGATVVIWTPIAIGALQTRMRLSKPQLLLFCLPLFISQAFAFSISHIQHPHRQAPITKQTQRFDGPGPLHGLYLEPEFIQLVSDISQTLKARGFDPGLDQILAPYEIPGLVVALDARAMGQSRYQDGIYNVEQLNCDILDIEWTVAPRRVYIIQTMPMNPLFLACVNKYIDVTNEAWESAPVIGNLTHRRNGAVYPIKVLGPFSPKQN